MATFVVIYACLLYPTTVRRAGDEHEECNDLACSEDYKLHLALPQPVHDRFRTEQFKQVRSRFEQVNEGPLFRVEV